MQSPNCIHNIIKYIVVYDVNYHMYMEEFFVSDIDKSHLTLSIYDSTTYHVL